MKARLDRLAKELEALQKETAALTRNYSFAEVLAMENGTRRDGAGANERLAREKFARIKEISAVLNTHHGN